MALSTPAPEPSLPRTGLESPCWTRRPEASPRGEEITVSAAPTAHVIPRPPGQSGSTSVAQRTRRLTCPSPGKPRLTTVSSTSTGPGPLLPLPCPPPRTPPPAPPRLPSCTCSRAPLRSSSLHPYLPTMDQLNTYFCSNKVGQLNTISRFFEPSTYFLPRKNI